MRIRRLSGLAVLAMVLFTTTSCATSQNVASGAMLNTQIQIDNNLPNIAGITTWIVTASGGRSQLGPIDSGRTGTFDRPLRAGNYTLVATRVGGQDITSERFRLDTDGLIVFWNVQANQVTFAQR